MKTEARTLLTPTSIAESLRDMGYQGKLHQTEDAVFIESSTYGLQFFVYCLSAKGDDVTAASDPCDAIRFYGGWDDLPHYEDRHLSEFVNWFNQSKRYGKVYRLNRGSRVCLRVEAEWLTRDGICPETFARFARIFFNLYNVVSEALGKIRSVDTEEIYRRHNQALGCIHGHQANKALAAELYRENSDAGYAGSQNNLGDLYERGEGVSRNLAYATYWYTRAAERGEPTAYLSLAEVLCSSAQHGDVDLWVDAGKFALLAAESLPDGRNKASANRLIGLVSNQLSEEDWARATELARTFYPLYQEQAQMQDAPEPGVPLETNNAALH